MLFVGLTEEHRKSAIMFSNMAVTQVISQSESSSSNAENKIQPILWLLKLYGLFNALIVMG